MIAVWRSSCPVTSVAPIVYLLGWTGVGKLTAANEQARRTGWRVLDSHRIYFPVLYAVGADGGRRRFRPEPVNWRRRCRTPCWKP